MLLRNEDSLVEVLNNFKNEAIEYTQVNFMD